MPYTTNTLNVNLDDVFQVFRCSVWLYDSESLIKGRKEASFPLDNLFEKVWLDLANIYLCYCSCANKWTVIQLQQVLRNEYKSSVCLTY